MRERRGIPWLAVCLLLADGAGTASPQAQRYPQTQRYADRVRGLESLTAVSVRALARLVAWDDSARAATSRLESARVGPFTLRATPDAMPLAQASLRTALDSITPTFGTAIDRLSGYTVVVRSEISPSYRRSTPDTSLSVSVLDASGAERGQLQVALSAARLAAAIGRLVANATLQQAAPAFMTWLGSGAPTAPLSEEQWRAVRLNLISSPAAIARRCFRGYTGSCEIALGLRAPADTIKDWFDANDRRALVARNAERTRALDPQWTRECLAGSDATCIAILRRAPWPLPSPVPASVRSALTRHAVEMGHGRAIERLAGVDGGPGERIAAAAGVPLPDVIRDWQLHVRTFRAPSRNLSWEISWIALGWVLGLGFLATRSSRWR